MVGAARGTSTNFVRNDQKQSYSQFHDEDDEDKVMMYVQGSFFDGRDLVNT